MSKLTTPSEILWKNMKGTRGLFIFRRFFLYLIGILVVLFGTTPAVILQNLIPVEKITQESNASQKIFSNFVFPFVVILIN